jgi:phage gpG-like protein
MLRFTFNVVNADELDVAIGGLAAQVKDWTNVWPKVAMQITKIEDQKFATEGALGAHGEWAALEPGYEKRKKKKWGGKPIEQASERLRRSLVEGSAETIEDFQPLRMRFGTSVPYALYQQTGFRTRLGTGKTRGSGLGIRGSRGSRFPKPEPRAFVPARRLVDFTEEDKSMIRSTIQREALETARRLGFAAAPYRGERDISAIRARQIGVAILSGEIPSPFPATGSPVGFP